MNLKLIVFTQEIIYRKVLLEQQTKQILKECTNIGTHWVAS